MKITIQNTTRITELITDTGSVPARLWEGETESGVKVQVLVTRIAALKKDDCSQFERELAEMRPPIDDGPFAFPLRMVL